MALKHLKKIVDDNPALYLEEIQRRLRKEYGRRYHVTTICRMLHDPISRGGLGYSTAGAGEASNAEGLPGEPELPDDDAQRRIPAPHVPVVR
eukprot:1657900-Rhodomonas_salina.1